MKHTKGTTGRMADRCLVLALSVVMVLSAAGCEGKGGSQPSGQTESDRTGLGQTQAAAFDSGKIVNIGVTSSLNTLDPPSMGDVEMNKYATGLMLLSLMELDQNMEFEGMLADLVTAEDERNFLVHIDDRAVWSDGTPATANDVVYIALRLCSPVIESPAMMYYVFEGVGDDGFVEEGADHMEGIARADDKTVCFTTKAPMSLITFNSFYARCLTPLLKYVIGDISEKALASGPWFSHPDVMSGLYKVTELGWDHYVSYEANKDYWKGVPVVECLNVKIVEGSQLYTGFKSGEIDITQNTMSTTPLENYEGVATLENVEVPYGAPITNQSVFINIDRITDTKARQAVLYAVDRSQSLEQLLKGNGEVADGFLSSASPYFDSSLMPASYDPEEAKSLLVESGWDQNKSIRFCIDLGDSTLVNAASAIVIQWAAMGIKADIQTMDINTLMSIVSSGDFDVLAVQYTYPPMDPYADVARLLGGEGSWIGRTRLEVEEVLSNVALTNDKDKLKELYGIVDWKVQEDVSIFFAYITRTMAVANRRLIGVKSSVYGFFNYVEQWDVTQQNISRQNVSHWKVSWQDSPIIGKNERIPGGHTLPGYLHSWGTRH